MKKQSNYAALRPTDSIRSSVHADENPAVHQPGRALSILRMKQLLERVRLSRSAIYDRLNPRSSRHDPTFPRQISLGGDAVGWLENEVEAWLQARTADSRRKGQQEPISPI